MLWEELYVYWIQQDTDRIIYILLIVCTHCIKWVVSLALCWFLIRLICVFLFLFFFLSLVIYMEEIVCLLLFVVVGGGDFLVAAILPLLLLQLVLLLRCWCCFIVVIVLFIILMFVKILTRTNRPKLLPLLSETDSNSKTSKAVLPYPNISNKTLYKLTQELK